MKKNVCIRVEEELLEKLREEARQEDISISSMARRIIKLYFARRCE
ncbi:MAG: ribbon-helix-helix protein, CopG family [Candidatus Caldarchaeum sp.]